MLLNIKLYIIKKINLKPSLLQSASYQDFLSISQATKISYPIRKLLGFPNSLSCVYYIN
jgi:hypothetical protein